jgi:hypothetical protein
VKDGDALLKKPKELFESVEIPKLGPVHILSMFKSWDKNGGHVHLLTFSVGSGAIVCNCIR